jgi:hypothetical protein
MERPIDPEPLAEPDESRPARASHAWHAPKLMTLGDLDSHTGDAPGAGTDGSGSSTVVTGS